MLFATHRLFFHMKPKDFELQSDMDEASQQLIRENQYAEAKLTSEMPLDSSTLRTCINRPRSGLMTLSMNHDSPRSRGSQKDPMSSLHSSLLEGRFSDLVLLHGNNRWDGHKLVVCSQSAVLESMIETHQVLSVDSSFAALAVGNVLTWRATVHYSLLDSMHYQDIRHTEIRLVEPAGSTDVLNLSKHPYSSVERLLEYLYTGSYTTRDTGPDFSLHSHIEVFNLSIILAIPSLRALAEEKFRYALNNHVTDLQVYFGSVQIIYRYTPREHPGLRNAVVEAAVTEINTLLDNQAVKKTFFGVMTSNPEFQTDMLRFLVDNPDRPVHVMMIQLCGDCGPMNEENKYVIDHKCKGCGKDRSIEFY